MREIYRQIGISVKFAALNSLEIPQNWFDQHNNERSGIINSAESRLLWEKLSEFEVPDKQIKVGYVDAEVISPNSGTIVNGWAFFGEAPVIVSIGEYSREILNTTAHEVGHVFELNDLWSIQFDTPKLMFGSGSFWRNSPAASKRFSVSDFNEFESKTTFYEPLH
jgi:hypothetical protein